MPPLVPTRPVGIEAFQPPPTETKAEPPMKILFSSVHLDIEIPRITPERGLANMSTSYFDVEKGGVTIELDVASGLVRLSKGLAEAYVPLSKVTRFGPVVTAAVVTKTEAA